MITGLTLDTGALIAIERGDRHTAGLVRIALDRRARVTVPAPVVIEWWRGQRGPIARLLDAFEVEALGERLARVAGEALARVHGATAIDAVVMASAAARGDAVITADLADLERLRVVFPGVRLLGIARPAG